MLQPWFRKIVRMPAGIESTPENGSCTLPPRILAQQLHLDSLISDCAGLELPVGWYNMPLALGESRSATIE